MDLYLALTFKINLNDIRVRLKPLAAHLIFSFSRASFFSLGEMLHEMPYQILLWYCRQNGHPWKIYGVQIMRI